MKKILFALIALMTLSCVLSCDPFSDPVEPTDEQMDLLTRSYDVVAGLRKGNSDLWKHENNPDDGTDIWTLLKPYHVDGEEEWTMEITSARYWSEYQGSLHISHLDYRFRYRGGRRHSVFFRMTEDMDSEEAPSYSCLLDGRSLIVVPEGQHPAMPLI